VSDKLDPIGTLFSSVEKLVYEPTWKRFFHLVLSVGVLLGAFLIFERYTRTFELARLERSVDVLRKLHALKAETGDTNEQELIRMGSVLESQMHELVKLQPAGTESQPNQIIKPSGWWKFLAALIPWALVIAPMVRAEAKKRGNVPKRPPGGDNRISRFCRSCDDHTNVALALVQSSHLSLSAVCSHTVNCRHRCSTGSGI